MERGEEWGTVMPLCVISFVQVYSYFSFKELQCSEVDLKGSTKRNETTQYPI